MNKEEEKKKEIPLYEVRGATITMTSQQQYKLDIT